MIKRIVKMQFEPSRLHEFFELFERTKMHIRGFEGCQHLELWKDISDPTILFTYSYWETPMALDHYRNSTLFKDTWAQTKPLFRARAEAWSIEVASVTTA
jgi:autoinducer 2-degrading protein